jgi:hypothetical protein
MTEYEEMRDTWVYEANNGIHLRGDKGVYETPLIIVQIPLVTNFGTTVYTTYSGMELDWLSRTLSAG